VIINSARKNASNKDDNDESFSIISKEDSGTDYDPIAKAFQQWDNSILNNYITDYTLLRHLVLNADGLEDKVVLDVGCGSGRLTRELLNIGTFKVVGVDKSEEQIQLAILEEKRHQSHNEGRIQYFVDDISTNNNTRNDDGMYDVVTQSWALNHASSYDELLGMCQYIASKLKTDGVFVGLNVNMSLDPYNFPKLWKYGIFLNRKKDAQDGDVSECVLKFEDGSSVTLIDYYLSHQTYEKAFLTAGFHSLEWIPVELSPNTLNPDYFKDYINFSHGIVMKAIKK